MPVYRSRGHTGTKKSLHNRLVADLSSPTILKTDSFALIDIALDYRKPRSKVERYRAIAVMRQLVLNLSSLISTRLQRNSWDSLTTCERSAIIFSDSARPRL